MYVYMFVSMTPNRTQTIYKNITPNLLNMARKENTFAVHYLLQVTYM